MANKLIEFNLILEYYCLFSIGVQMIKYLTLSVYL